MFKKFIYKAAVITVIAISACSCNKFLELRPQNGITSDQFWLTKEQLGAAVTGIYNSLLTSSGSYKSPAEVFFIWGEIRADMIAPGVSITADEQNIINTAILPTNAIVNWQPMYRIINLCNYVLDFGPGVLAKDATLTQAQLNQYLGEALALRALMYFYLVRSYRDVPLKLTSTSTDSDLAQIPKTDSKTILAQIVADLKTAEGYLPTNYADNATDKGRVNRFTVNTIQADVYLWMDDYADCITACNKVINSGKYALVPGGNGLAGNSSWFSTLYVNGNSVEGIFELQFDSQQLNPYYTMFSPANVNFRYRPEINLIDDFYTEDPAGINVDIRGIDVAEHVADQSIYKYVATSPTSLRTPANSFAHWIMYRYADVLLMKAEAEINDGVDGADALALINQIRARAFALPGSSQSPSPSDVAGMTTYLVAERAREFAFEGKRWYDLLRNAKRNNFARKDLLTTAAILSVPALYQQSAISKISDPNFLYFPVPTYDLQLDPNLVQNPFYTK